MSRILGIVHGCLNCPNKGYYSGGRYECRKVQEVIPADVLQSSHDMPAWCPLPEHPAHAMERLRAEINTLRASKGEPDGNG